MRTMENLIVDIYNESIENYNKIHKMIDKKITNPDELVEMEGLKAKFILIEKSTGFFDKNYHNNFYLD